MTSHRSPAWHRQNETFLDQSVGDVDIEGYAVVGRRDRSYGNDDRRCGGVAVYVQAEIVDSMTLLHKSPDHERVWILFHSNLGPLLLCSWYRPPVPGEIDSIHTLRKEWDELNHGAIGTILVGDLNVHHKKWLRWSARNSAGGEHLRNFCLDVGMQQIVRGPTRGDYLLDCAISDLEGLACQDEEQGC